METRNLKHIYKNKLDKACFAHDHTCSGIKDLSKRTIKGKSLKKRSYEIAINPKYNAYQT